MARRMWLILFVLVMVSAALRVGPAAAADEKVYLQFESLKFFEGPFKAPAAETRQYQVRFPKSSTRYVFFSVVGVNLLYKNRAHKSVVVGRYYKPDGSFMGEGKVDVDIPSDWETADLWSGWGWDVQGNWPIGNYRVEILFGNSKVGEGYFSIYDDAPAEEKTYLEFQSVKLFEGGAEDVPEDQRVYGASFPRSKARYIYFSINAKNLLYRNRTQKPFVGGRYYYPDGSLMGEAKINIEIPADWAEADLWNAWGWSEPGKWSLGTYRVEIWFGNTKVGEGRFNIYDDRK